MRLGGLICVIALSALVGCAPDPYARPEMAVATPEGLVDASKPDPISDIAWRYGEASWQRDDLGDPIIFATLEEAPYLIEFYGCDEGKNCTDLRFVAYGAPDREVHRNALVWKVSEWNRDRRFGKAVMTEEGGLLLEMNVSLQGGVTRQNLDTTFDWWRIAMSEFHSFANKI
ncbi:MAG: YbjN domain-containing protein [Pseudomonadota bacterium]